MAKVHPIHDYRFSEHAKQEMARRQISVDAVAAVLAEPEQTAVVSPGRIVCQSRVEWPDPPRIYLLRVFVDIDRVPSVVVTAYRTSRIEKYWSG